LIESGPRVLPPFDPSLATAAQRALEKLGVEIRLGGAVTACDELGVELGGERIEARTIIWAAGVMASPAGKWLNVETDRNGRVIVGPDLAVPGNRDIFVLGDTASVPGPDGKPLPGIAPVAKAQGNYVAARIVAELEGRAWPPFRYSDLGSLATVGRKSAVVQIGRLRLTGFIAWLIWSVAHIYFLIGFRNRLSVVLNWAWNYFTFQRGTRLITGLSGSRMDNIAAPAAPLSEHVGAKDRIRGDA
jgi:NADH:ubiquinone reductase (H+-translocating)